MAVLRVHRSAAAGPVSFVSLISVLFAVSPWMLPAPAGVILGLVAHAAFFAACERLLAPSITRAPAPPPAPLVARPPSMAAHHLRRMREFVSVPILAVIDETPDIRTFRMARPDGLAFQAGQFLTVRVRADGRDHARCYSISSAPYAAGYLEISVKRHGLVSGALHATLRPGAMLAIKGPAGTLVCPTDDDRPIVLVAGGVGITPLMSILRQSLIVTPSRPVTMFYAVRTERDLAFGDELRVLDRRHPQFRLVVAVSSGATRTDVYAGQIDATLITTMAPDLAHSVAFVCGPPPMMTAVVAMLAEAGVPPGQVRKEVFDPAVVAGVVPTLEDRNGLPATAEGAHQLRFTRSGRDARVTASQTLLEAADACGAGIPSFCRAGVCGTCRTKVLTGEVECHSQVLDEQDRVDGYVLACVSRIRSDCTIDA